MSNPTKHSVWQELKQQAAELEKSHDFGLDLTVRGGDIIGDLSRHRLNSDILDNLIKLAQAQDLEPQRDAMFKGEHVNVSEDRPVLHSALRNQDQISVHGEPIRPTIEESFKALYAFAESVRRSQNIKNVVHIGIGGSMLGVQTVLEALQPYKTTDINIYIVANVDGADLHQVLKQCAPEETLFYIASKSFTTVETMTNAKVAREWIVSALGEKAVNSHFAAATTNVEAAKEFGLSEDSLFGFENWVGGRFSSWSSIGLPIIIALGQEGHQAWLEGARKIDEHFRTAPLKENLPVLLGLIGIWYRNFLDCPLYTVSGYAQNLSGFGRYVQQIDMESNGKSVDRDGNPVNYHTGPLVFGEPGTNAQHSYFQLIHQGTSIVPTDFIVVEEPQYKGYHDHHAQLLANAKAQPKALWQGRSVEEAGGDPHRAFPGKRPSNVLTIQALTPATMGMLMALYEAKIAVQGFIWNINSFDQFGVELGKEMATAALEEASS